MCLIRAATSAVTAEDQGLAPCLLAQKEKETGAWAAKEIGSDWGAGVLWGEEIKGLVCAWRPVGLDCEKKRKENKAGNKMKRNGQK